MKSFIIKRHIIEHFAVDAEDLKQTRLIPLENPFRVEVLKETCKLDKRSTYVEKGQKMDKEYFENLKPSNFKAP